jgi:predicted PurR-regulated permease PerM
VRGTPPRRDPLRVLLWAVSFAFALFLAYRFLTVVATVALLFAVAVLLAVAASGPIEALAKRRVPRTPAAAVVFLGGAGLLALGGALLVFVAEGQLLAFLSSLPAALSELSARVEDLASRLGVPLPGDGDRSAFSLVSQARRIVGGGVVGLFSTAASVLVGLVVVFFLSFYFAANPGPVVGWAARLFPPERRPRVREMLSAVRSALLGWLKGQLGAMAIIGALSTAAFFLIGLPGALFLGLLAGLLNFVPYVGPIVSFIPPLLLALLISPFTVLLVAAAYAGGCSSLKAT